MIKKKKCVRFHRCLWYNLRSLRFYMWDNWRTEIYKKKLQDILSELRTVSVIHIQSSQFFHAFLDCFHFVFKSQSTKHPYQDRLLCWKSREYSISWWCITTKLYLLDLRISFWTIAVPRIWLDSFRCAKEAWHYDYLIWKFMRFDVSWN